MVRKLLLAVLGCGVVLAVSACQLLFVGAFPASAAQATARADMSATIASSAASTFNLSRVTAGGKEYFLLVSPLNFDPTRAHIVVLDDSLHVLNTFTTNDLGGATSGSPYAMTDVNGDVIIGDFLFTQNIPPLPNGLTFNGSSLVPLNGPSVTGLPSFGNNEANFSLMGGNLTWTEYDIAWTSLGSPPFLPIGGPSALFLSNVLTERDSEGMPDVFFFRDSSNMTYILLVPKGFIDDTGPPGWAQFYSDVFGSTIFSVFGQAGLIIQKSNLENSIGLAYGEVFAYDDSAKALIHFNISNPSSVNNLPMKWNQGSQIAAGATGTFCVVWDPTARTLTRYDQWW